MGFSGTMLIIELFFTFCFPIILLVFFLMVYRDYRRRKRRLENMLQGFHGKKTTEEE